jgi:putative redox protein
MNTFAQDSAKVRKPTSDDGRKTSAAIEVETKEATIVWREAMQFEGTATSGYTLPLDAGASVGGQEAGFRPMELILMGLAGCTGMDVLSILRKKRQDVTGFEVHVRGQQAEDHPRVYTSITVEYVVRGRGIAPGAVARAITLSEYKYCPVHAMLRESVPIECSFRIEEHG